MPASSRVPGIRLLSATLYGYAFFDDFVLLYPVYALLFADTGLSNWRISSLFVIWSVTGTLFEVPSGVLADACSRRLVLCVGPVLTAAGYALWVSTPSYWAFVVGFVLWGVKGALVSGALEALVYEELVRRGAAGRYPRIRGRSQAVGMLAVLLATVGAGPVLHAGGYRAVGLASVAACLLTAAIATLLPEHRFAGPAEHGDRELGYLATLRAGIAECRADRAVRSALLLVPAVAGVWGALEEYTPLLARGTGVAESTVPLLLALVWAGVTAGSVLAGAGAGGRLTAKGLSGLLAIAGVVLVLGAGSGHPAGIALVAAAFGVLQAASVLADTRLQERITGPSRATVTSLAALATEVTTIAVFAGYATVASAAGHQAGFALCGAAYLGLAVWAGRSGRRTGSAGSGLGDGIPARADASARDGQRVVSSS